MPAHAALQYAPEAFAAGVAKIMGRHSAGNGFLRGWLAYAEADPVACFTPNDGFAEAFAAQVAELAPGVRTARAGPRHEAVLVDAGALWLADPSIGLHAWDRRAGAQDRWSIVGITHTINSHASLDRIADYLTAPVQPWDALICTSRAVKAAVTTLLETQARYLQERTGATRLTGPELPVIPLGVHCDDFAAPPGARERWRAELGIPADAVAVLHFGRLAIHAKAHPLPVYLALEAAIARGAPAPHLIIAGQFPDARQERDFRAVAAYYVGCITTHFVDGARPETGAGIRAAADIFTLLSDNFQESFGLAPVEAMAAGLPVVGSDWDGLRDTIVHGETGFLAPTIVPPDPCGEIAARRYAMGLDHFDNYSGATVQSIAVDIAAAGAAFHALLTDAPLRARMGAAAAARARSVYDWRVVIGQYRTLLAALAERRAKGDARVPRAAGQPPMPARDDPFRLFAGHATRRLAADTRIALRPNAPEWVADVAGGTAATMLVPPTLLAPVLIDAMIAELRAAPRTVSQLVQSRARLDQRLVGNSIGFLLKYGFAEIVD